MDYTFDYGTCKTFPLAGSESAKESKSIVRWIMRALSKDQARPVLQCVKLEFVKMVDDAYPVVKMVSTDGFRIHVAENITLPLRLNGPAIIQEPLESGLYEMRFSGDFLTLKKQEGNYPDYEAVFPKEYQDAIPEGIAFNGKFLAETGDIPNCELVKMKFGTHNTPAMITGFDSNKNVIAFAVLMPMHLA
jgi:DNA polymerase III sliding clamp (beta) subunit (PCNA family)